MWAELERLDSWIRVGALAVALSLVLSTPLAAQKSARSASESKYQDLVRRALEEYAAGNWTEARVFFEDAHTISPNARTLRGLGMTSYEARSYVESISFLEQALASTVRPLTSDLAKEARKVLEQARRFVSSVDIELEPPDAELRVDGKLIAKDARAKLVLDPGEHEFTASADGFAPARRLLVAEGGRRLNLHLVLTSDQPVAPVAQPATSPAQTRAPAEAPARTRLVLAEQSVAPGVILAALGTAGLVSGWVFYSMRQDVRTTPIDNAEIAISKVDDMNTKGYLSLSLGAAGALLLALSDYFWLPNEPMIPVWAWSVGALGVIAAGVGIALGVLGTHCRLGDPRVACQSFGADTFLAPLVAMHGLPFLAVPLAYAIRKATRTREVEISVQFGDAHAFEPGLRLSARF